MSIFKEVRENQRKKALYDYAVGLIELFIDGTRHGVLKTQVLHNVFSFISKIAQSKTHSEISSRIIIDLLSVIMIHLIVDDTSKLLDQLLELDVVPFFYKIL